MLICYSPIICIIDIENPDRFVIFTIHSIQAFMQSFQFQIASEDLVGFIHLIIGSLLFVLCRHNWWVKSVVVEVKFNIFLVITFATKSINIISMISSCHWWVVVLWIEIEIVVICEHFRWGRRWAIVGIFVQFIKIPREPSMKHLSNQYMSISCKIFLENCEAFSW